ncbi:hypothetical protein T4B_7664 [Trichinella pseudospiralis]|uniref:Uncharacterized protein n=1 Tax=Trichinella pseudospiralis TaxID=6337 RepID=A0A0V1JMW8_TRIPS|nr:hypothetical protein T4B_7664 [Trichinella pseudospiralis]KRZ36283.1 hypothetical protein T4C_5180 [Trichinella pseudospiralis]
MEKLKKFLKLQCTPTRANSCDTVSQKWQNNLNLKITTETTFFMYCPKDHNDLELYIKTV